MPNLAIVDDSAIVTEAVVGIIRRAFPAIEIAVFSMGQDILEALRNGIRYTAVIMDGKLLDGYTGPMYTSKILEIASETYIIGFSSQDSMKGLFLKAGARVFLPKIADTQDIIACVKTALGL